MNREERRDHNGPFAVMMFFVGRPPRGLRYRRGVGGAPRRWVDYDPEPPFHAGSVTTAPAEIISAMTAIRDFIVYGGAPAT